MAKSVEPSHLAEERISIRELIDSMALDPALLEPPPVSIGIFDDVLTTGRHFRAVQTVLRSQFPDVPIAGIFIARRAPESTPL